MRGQRILPQYHGQQLLAALETYSEALESGALVTIEASKTRFRVLPIIRQ
jgi:hypothetical protein